MIIDSHIHLTAKEFAEDLDAYLDEAQQAGINYFINIGAGYGSKTAIEAVALAEKYDFIYASVGIHPLDAHNSYDIAVIKDLAQHDKVVAVGETGFDFYYQKETRREQERAFEQQIQIALDENKPLIIHSRDAGQESLTFCRQGQTEYIGGVFHCYSENTAFAEELIKMNYKISFPGVLTFKNAELARQVAEEIDLEHIMLETDAPFLAPVPYRGKLCRPVYIQETAEKLAEVKNIPLAECLKTVYNTTINFYKLPIPLAE